MDFIEVTKHIWNTYILENEQGNYDKVDGFAPECVVIGTGKHEVYRNLEEFSKALSMEAQERQDIRFQFKDFWCEQKEITPDVYLVYGGLFIWWESEDKSIFINMDSRFTMLYKKIQDEWKIVHVHQSVPNMEQADGEYYPKTLAEQVKEEQEKAEALKELAHKDTLTGLLNYHAFEETYQGEGESRQGQWMILADLDNFKMVNDTCGHMKGNQVLKKAAGVLKSTVRSSDVVCRMGGDEFLLLCGGIREEQEAGELMQRIVKNIEAAGVQEPVWIGISLGGTMVRNGDTLEEVFRRADAALYDVKNHRKNGWKIK